jgi:hypothetical protein
MKMKQCKSLTKRRKERKKKQRRRGVELVDYSKIILYSAQPYLLGLASTR